MGGGGFRGSRSLSERECNRVTETRYSVVQRYSHTKISDNGAKYSTTTLISSFVTRNQLNIPNFEPKDSQSNVNSWFIKLFQFLTIFRTYKGTYGFFLKNQTNKTSNNTWTLRRKETNCKHISSYEGNGLRRCITSTFALILTQSVFQIFLIYKTK